MSEQRAGMLVVTGRVTAAAGKADELRAALLAVIPGTRAEAGNVAYDLFEAKDRPGEFLLIEHWESEAALSAHKAGPDYQGFFRAVASGHFVDGSPEEIHWRAVG